MTTDLINTVSSVTLLDRPRVRIPEADPDAPDFAWERVPLLPGLEQSLWRLAAAPRTEVRAVAHARALCIRFDCFVEDFARLAAPSNAAPLNQLERVSLRVHPRNDPTDYFLIEAEMKGMRSVKRVRRMPGETSLENVPDMWESSTPVVCASADWNLYHGMGRGKWWAELELPWGLFELEAPPPVIGFCYSRIYATGMGYPRLDEFAWPGDGFALNGPETLRSGEALIGADAGAPQGVEFLTRSFGANHGRVVLGREWPRRPRAMKISVLCRDEVVASARQDVPEDAGTVPFAFELPRRHSSHLDVFHPLRVEFQFVDERGTVRYVARLPMERHLGLCVDEPHGEPARAPAAPAARGRDAWLDRVARQLPRLRRATTCDGAPSDFCLLHDDGTLAVNLMADDAWTRLAAIVEDRFATTEDRLVAATALIGQKAVTNLILGPMFFDASGRHNYHSAAHELMGPLSVLRYGGGPAVSRGAALAGLLAHMRDAAGRPFSTRVISLTASGGPRQVLRSYAGVKSLAPFVQEPGMVGAVAVAYGAGLTLLDPTALAFFAKPDGSLATLEEMRADEAMRVDGAGRLASVYAAVDPEEVCRQPPDQLLSLGVFPELCPDEAAAATFIPPGAAQVPCVIHVPAGAESLPAGGFVDGMGAPGRRDPTVRIRATQAQLTVKVDVRGVAPGALGARDRAVERVHVLVDSGHDHTRFHHFVGGLAGSGGAWRERYSPIQTLFKRLSSENWDEECALAPEAWHVEILERADGYDAIFTLPLRALGLPQLPRVIGLNVWVEGRTPIYEQMRLAPARYRVPADPFCFADVYLHETPVHLGQIDYGALAWGLNTGRVVVTNRGDSAAGVTIQAFTRLGMQRSERAQPPVTVTCPPHGETPVEFTFFLDPAEKMGGGRAQSIVLQGCCDGSLFFQSAWELSYCTSPGVYQRYGAALPASPDPEPGGADYIPRKVAYICSRIPEFDRLTTRDGAPSDFVIRARDGSAEFDFMKAGVLDRMGAYVAGLYDTDLDRVLGIYFLSHHPAVARHLSSGHRFNNGCGPLSLIRLFFAGGGGNCGFHSRVFAGMASHLQLGPHRVQAHTLGIWGHCIAAFGWRGSKALIDADVGHFMLTPDGRDIATIEQLRRGEPVLSTAGDGDLARYFSFEEGYTRECAPLREDVYKGVFPPGAPRE